MASLTRTDQASVTLQWTHQLHEDDHHVQVVSTEDYCPFCIDSLVETTLMPSGLCAFPCQQQTNENNNVTHVAHRGCLVAALEYRVSQKFMNSPDLIKHFTTPYTSDISEGKKKCKHWTGPICLEMMCPICQHSCHVLATTSIMVTVTSSTSSSHSPAEGHSISKTGLLRFFYSKMRKNKTAANNTPQVLQPLLSYVLNVAVHPHDFYWYSPPQASCDTDNKDLSQAHIIHSLSLKDPLQINIDTNINSCPNDIILPLGGTQVDITKLVHDYNVNAVAVTIPSGTGINNIHYSEDNKKKRDQIICMGIICGAMGVVTVVLVIMLYV